jgi:hypothetical protein|tara:strand:+ start:1502 stop:1711 length:210 start_codon:yes stop_codon:yes gene_type:complete
LVFVVNEILAFTILPPPTRSGEGFFLFFESNSSQQYILFRQLIIDTKPQHHWVGGGVDIICSSNRLVGR